MECGGELCFSILILVGVGSILVVMHIAIVLAEMHFLDVADYKTSTTTIFYDDFFKIN